MISNRIFWFIGIVLVFFIIKARFIDDKGDRWRRIVDTDGRGYYAHLPAILIYHDLDYRFIDSCETSVQGINRSQQFIPVDGRLENKYFVGEAVLLLPFFLLAYVISYFALNDLSGYNVIFFSSVAVAAVFYAFVGLIFIRKTLKLYKVKEKWIGLVLLLLVFGTNVFHYVVYEPSVSHIYSFAMVSTFIYLIKKFQLEKTGSYLILSSIVLGLITIIRPVNVMIVLSIPFLAGSYDGFKKFLNDVLKSGWYLLFAIAGFIAVIFIQLLVYYFTHGQFYIWTYRYEGLDFYNPHFWQVLISYRKGLFVYTPLMLVAILFVIPYFKRSTFASISFILCFVIVTYVISCWSSWEYGGSFSMRPFLEYYPLLILPMAFALNEIVKPVVIASFLVLFFMITTLCIFQTYQYQYGIITFINMDKEKYWKVFLKSDRRYKVVASPPLVEKVSHDSIVLRKTFINDFEIPEGDFTGQYNKSEFYSGKQCMKVDKNAEFSQGFQSSYNQLGKDSIFYLEVSMMTKKHNDKNDAALIVSMETPDFKIYDYFSYPVSLLMNNKNKWERMEYSVKLPRMGPDDLLKVYVWNPSESPFFIDDFKVELFSRKY